jgi:hypothetical protein
VLEKTPTAKFVLLVKTPTKGEGFENLRGLKSFK